MPTIATYVEISVYFVLVKQGKEKRSFASVFILTLPFPPAFLSPIIYFCCKRCWNWESVKLLFTKNLQAPFVPHMMV